jgi:hypothetical protein
MDVKAKLAKINADNREAAEAVNALAKVLAGAPTEVTHAYLVRNAERIETAAKRVCKGIANWKKHY